MSKPVLFSGIKPSGDLNIGGFLGSVNNWLKMQSEYRCIFSIVDLHAITVPQEPTLMHKRSLDLAKLFLASGLLKKNIIFIQSQVTDHAELAWILNCFTRMGELKKMTQYKEKSVQIKEQASAGLFNYPVLMAADILLYQTTMVPVGEDQIQHVELARDIAKRFNHHFNQEIFTVPQYYVGKFGARIKGLQNPSQKMSKSNDNVNDTIFMLDSADVIRKKIMKAVTDADDKIKYDPIKKPGISNLLTMYAVFSEKSLDETEKIFAHSQYGAFKKELAEQIIKTLTPIQEKFLSYSDQEIIKLLKINARQAAKIAAPTINKVKNVLGFIN